MGPHSEPLLPFLMSIFNGLRAKATALESGADLEESMVQFYLSVHRLKVLNSERAAAS